MWHKSSCVATKSVVQIASLTTLYFASICYTNCRHENLSRMHFSWHKWVWNCVFVCRVYMCHFLVNSKHTLILLFMLQLNLQSDTVSFNDLNIFQNIYRIKRLIWVWCFVNTVAFYRYPCAEVALHIDVIQLIGTWIRRMDSLYRDH